MPAEPPEDGRPAAPPRPVRLAAAWSAAVLLVVAVAALLVWALVELQAATVPVVVALLGTALLAVPLCAAGLGVITVLRRPAGPDAATAADAGDDPGATPP